MHLQIARGSVDLDDIIAVEPETYQEKAVTKFRPLFFSESMYPISRDEIFDKGEINSTARLMFFILVPFSKLIYDQVTYARLHGLRFINLIARIIGFVGYSLLNVNAFIPLSICLIWEPIQADMICLLVLFGIVSCICRGFTLLNNVFSENHQIFVNAKAACARKILWDRHQPTIMNKKKWREYINELLKSDLKVWLLELAIRETRSLDACKDSFKFKVLEGYEEEFNSWVQISSRQVDEYFEEIKTQDKSKYYSGSLLLSVILSHVTTRNVLFFWAWGGWVTWGSLTLCVFWALRLLALVIPLYETHSVFTEVVNHHSELFQVLFVYCIIFYYVIQLNNMSVWTFEERRIVQYFKQLKWASFLINTNKDKEETFKERDDVFKLNIFCEYTLETWFNVMLSLKKIWIKMVSGQEKAFLAYFIYLAVFTAVYLTAVGLHIDSEPYLAYGYVFIFYYTDVICGLIALLYYLFYGYKVNDYAVTVTEMLSNLTGLYDSMLDCIDDVIGLNLDQEVKSKKYAFLFKCLIGELQNCPKDQLVQKGREKLLNMKQKAESILARYRSNQEREPHKFAGILECNLLKYEAIALTGASAIWAVLAKYIIKVT